MVVPLVVLVVCSELTRHLRKKKLVWIFHIIRDELLTTCHLLARSGLLVPRRPAASTVKFETRQSKSNNIQSITRVVTLVLRDFYSRRVRKRTHLLKFRIKINSDSVLFLGVILKN